MESVTSPFSSKKMGQNFTPSKDSLIQGVFSPQPSKEIVRNLSVSYSTKQSNPKLTKMNYSSMKSQLHISEKKQKDIEKSADTLKKIIRHVSIFYRLDGFTPFQN